MSHNNTVFHQITSFLPRHDFEKLAKEHHQGQKFRSYSRWSQCCAMMFGQLTGRKSLRDIAGTLAVQQKRLYHLGMTKTSRATLARVNENQPYKLYEKLFAKLLSKTQALAQKPQHKFKFEGKVYLLDATMIELCLSVFEWAQYRKTKGAMKVHYGLDVDGYLPVFMVVTSGKIAEGNLAQLIDYPKGSCLVFDRGYNDYSWFQRLTEQGINFVTRLKKKANYSVFGNSRKLESEDFSLDHKIKLKGHTADFRLIKYTEPVTGQEYEFLTNNLKLPASQIAALYKERWQIELFFKWIKQNLKVKTFLGISKNAVLTQLWIAMCVYLILSYLKFKAALAFSLTEILRLLQLTLFEARKLEDLLRPPDIPIVVDSPQLTLWKNL